MNLSIKNLLRLLLITAMVLVPVQGAFSMPMGMHADSSAIETSDHAHSAEMQGAEMKMLDENSCTHGDCGNCQGSTHCGSCPISLAIFQINPIRNEVGTQFRVTISGVSLNSTDLLPDYRPPRFS